ncbi:MAG TPA: hypothetical protein PLN28_04615, partial [Anaerolineaceae bacterium]|nr:hypothetical protein [Anaerolineaceae bacterium]
MAWSGHWGAALERSSPTSIEQPESDKQLKNNASNPPEIAPEHRERIKQVNERLLAVFGYPEWRQPLPAVDELVCTFLSQNTNDINRDKAFQA